MRRLVLHLIVATLAFVVGVTAATLLGSVTGRGRDGRRFKRVHVERHERHNPPARAGDCPYSRGMSDMPLPPVPPAIDLPHAPPEPPLPPVEAKPSKLSKEKRIRIRRADGTVEIIVQRAEEVR